MTLFNKIKSAKQVQANQKEIEILKQENLNIKVENHNLKSHIEIIENTHQTEILSLRNKFFSLDSSRVKILSKYKDISDRYSHLQGRLTESENRKAHLQIQLDCILDENRDLFRKIAYLEQFRPNDNNSPPLDLSLSKTSATKPPEIAYDLVTI